MEHRTRKRTDFQFQLKVNVNDNLVANRLGFL